MSDHTHDRRSGGPSPYHVHVCGPDPAVVADFWKVIDTALVAHGARRGDGPNGITPPKPTRHLRVISTEEATG